MIGNLLRASRHRLSQGLPRLRKGTDGRPAKESQIIIIAASAALYFSLLVFLTESFLPVSEHMQRLLHVLGAVAIAGASVTLLLIRAGASATIASNALLGFLCAGALYGCYHGGGLLSPFAIVLSSLPLVAVLTANLASSVIWFLLVCASWTGLLLGPVPLLSMPLQDQQVALAVNLFTTLGLNGLAVATHFSTVRNQQREHSSERRKYMALATLDSLTGLPNRRFFTQRMREEIERADETHTGFCLLYIDLNNFKFANDNYGHQFGDRLLVRFASSLKEVLRREDLIARVGGDEFCVILNGVTDTAAVELKIASIAEITSKHFKIGEVPYQISSSVGYALYPEDGQSFGSLLYRADRRMYKIKRGEVESPNQDSQTGADQANPEQTKSGPSRPSNVTRMSPASGPKK